MWATNCNCIIFSETTTDHVLKAIELISLGPVLFIDTAGLGDKNEVGKLRIKRTMNMINMILELVMIFLKILKIMI